MKDGEKEFESYARQIEFDDTPDHNHRDKLEQKLLIALANQPRQISSPLQIPRTIMKSKPAKFASAAAIIIAVTLGLSTILDHGASPAYAIDQTVEAIKNIPTVHIFGRDWDEKQIEMWVQVNTDTGLMEYCYINHIDDDRLMISTPENTYHHNLKTNTVRIKDGPSVSSVFRLGEFFEGMKLVSEKFDGQITYSEVFDPSTKKKRIDLKMSSPKLEIRSLIDPQTKLPISISITRGEKFGTYETLKHATQIHYDNSVPEGLFDFKIPVGATIIKETIEDPLQKLPESVIQYCVQFHLKVVEETANTAGIPIDTEIHSVDDQLNVRLKVLEEVTNATYIPTNTQIYFVDDQFDLRIGGFLGIYNYTDEIWTGEVGLGNFDRPNVALFDENGKKQQIRLVQRRQFSPGKYRLYWILQEPLHPGQARGGIYWINDPRKLHKSSSDGTYHLRMSNTFGCEAVENFILILPSDFKVCDRSREYISSDNVDEYGIYIWQRHLPKHRINNTVDVSLTAK
jgi:hypothetical protein